MTELEGQGIGFQSVTEAIDTTTPGGKLVFHIFGALAEFERNLIRERTKAGLDAARRREEGWPSEGGGSSARVSLTGTSSVAFSRSMTCPLTAPSSGIDGTPLLVWAVLMVEDNRDSPHREVVGDRLITRHLPNGE